MKDLSFNTTKDSITVADSEFFVVRKRIPSFRFMLGICLGKFEN